MRFLASLAESIEKPGRSAGAEALLDRWHFTVTQERFLDNLDRRARALGEALEGPRVGETLVAVEHLDTFWFAWGTFQPETTLWAPTG